MSYSRPPSKSAGDAFDLTAYNAVRDSLIASAPDVFTTKGDLFVATGADAGVRVAVGANGSIIVADSSTASGLAYQIMPRCVVTRNSAQDPNTSSWVTMLWDAENDDSFGMHSTGSNTDRITIPSGGAGAYFVGCNIGFLTSALTPGDSGQYGVRIRYNASEVIVTHFDEAEMQSQDLWVSLVMTTKPSVADHYQVQVWTNQDVDISADSKFWAQWQSR